MRLTGPDTDEGVIVTLATGPGIAVAVKRTSPTPASVARMVDVSSVPSVGGWKPTTRPKKTGLTSRTNGWAQVLSATRATDGPTTAHNQAGAHLARQTRHILLEDHAGCSPSEGRWF